MYDEENKTFTIEEIERKLLNYISWRGAISDDYSVEDFVNFLEDERGFN